MSATIYNFTIYKKTTVTYWVNLGYSPEEADIMSHQYRVELGHE
mgnify:CR=1 FL=1|jgi:hypothetical protein